MDIKRIYREITTMDMSHIAGRPEHLPSKMTTIEIQAYLEHLNKHHKATLIRFAKKWPTLGCIDVKAFIL